MARPRVQARGKPQTSAPHLFESHPLARTSTPSASSAAGQLLRASLGVALIVLLGACASRSQAPAPVEDRTRPVAAAPAAKAPVVDVAPAPAPAGVVAAVVRPADLNAGKPGYYTVKPGDTLIRIGLETGQNFRDITRWNALENPNMIEVGQVLRVTPPGPDVGVVVTRPVASGVVATGTVAAAGTKPAPVEAAVVSDEDIRFIWPAPGAVLAGFDGEKNKGLDIAGKPGDSVVAAADGKVIYAGSSLRGYGNLIILKHNDSYLTAYAHNQTLLVKEDQAVRKGQKIAEMGQTESDRVKLHFEVRRLGKAIDPAKMLPAR